MGISSPNWKFVSRRTFLGPPSGGFLKVITGIGLSTGPLRILSVVVRSRFAIQVIHKRDGPKLPYQAVVIRQSAIHRKGRNAVREKGGVDPHGV